METTQDTVVTITEKAAEKARSLIDTKGLAEGALRVFVVGGGCSGYQYGMALAQGADEGDITVQMRGVTILVDPDSAAFLQGAEIDYVDDLMKSGFTIYNPNATHSCACGQSFDTADGGGSPRRCC